MQSPPLVTLIVPTVHHRAALFARTLRYLDGIGWRAPIVVSDHSPTTHAGVIAEATRRHAGLDLKLLRHPPEMHFLARLSACATAAQTPYVHLHADDDFVVPETLHKLVDAMQRDAACSAAMGINLHAFVENGEMQVIAKDGLGHSGAFERLVAQLESYSSALYALRRRDELIGTFAFTVERCPDVQFWQYLESCVAALRGTFVMLDELHYVRSQHTQKWSAVLAKERSPDHFPYLILSPAFQQRVAAFRAALLEACAGADAGVDTARLDAGLIHLLYRGFDAVGLPQRTTTSSGSAKASGKTMLERLNRPHDAARTALERIFNLANG